MKNITDQEEIGENAESITIERFVELHFVASASLVTLFFVLKFVHLRLFLTNEIFDEFDYSDMFILFWV